MRIIRTMKLLQVPTVAGLNPGHGRPRRLTPPGERSCYPHTPRVRSE